MNKIDYGIAMIDTITAQKEEDDNDKFLEQERKEETRLENEEYKEACREERDDARDQKESDYL